MNTYFVTYEISVERIVKVQALSSEHAKELVKDGYGEITEESDSGNMEIFEVNKEDE